jgi:hypothetical protein
MSEMGETPFAEAGNARSNKKHRGRRAPIVVLSKMFITTSLVIW